MKNNTNWDRILDDPAVRKSLAERSHRLFFLLYFQEYVTYPLAFFHHEMLSLTEDLDEKVTAFMAFRGSGKSTIANTSAAIWSIVGRRKSRFVVIVSRTEAQAKAHLASISRELEDNDLLKADFGPFRHPGRAWGAKSIAIPKYDAVIVAASVETGIRGLRHGNRRPDLVILDDVEDLKSTEGKASRDRTYAWFKGEAMLVGDENTRIVVLGNLLHEESLLMRVREEIDDGRMPGTFRAYPFLDDRGSPLWPERFGEKESAEAFREAVSDDETWKREYLLNTASVMTLTNAGGPRGTWRGKGIPIRTTVRKVSWRGRDYEISAPLAGFIMRRNYSCDFEDDDDD